MLTLRTEITVDGMTGRQVFDFLADPTDSAYRAWWPGTHLQFHLVRRGEGHVGDVVYMDEYVGDRRLRMSGVVVDAVAGKRLVWQLKRGVRLPVRLSLELGDGDDGVRITHTTRAGFGGAGRLLDPLWRLYFTRGFAAALDDHVRTEFPLLRDLLRSGRAA